jgi:ABC-2 type transport system ATP-binding protein
LLDLIQRLSRDGMTIILSSHMLDVVQSICHRVALFNRGRIGFIGTVEELAARIGGGAFVVDVEADRIDLERAVAAIPDIKAVRPVGSGHWEVEATRDVRPDLARRVVADGGALKNLDLRRARLDQAYNRYFKEAAHVS